MVAKQNRSISKGQVGKSVAQQETDLGNSRTTACGAEVECRLLCWWTWWFLHVFYPLMWTTGVPRWQTPRIAPDPEWWCLRLSWDSADWQNGDFPLQISPTRFWWKNISSFDDASFGNFKTLLEFVYQSLGMSHCTWTFAWAFSFILHLKDCKIGLEDSSCPYLRGRWALKTKNMILERHLVATGRPRHSLSGQLKFVDLANLDCDSFHAGWGGYPQRISMGIPTHVLWYPFFLRLTGGSAVVIETQISTSWTSIGKKETTTQRVFSTESIHLAKRRVWPQMSRVLPFCAHLGEKTLT